MMFWYDLRTMKQKIWLTLVGCITYCIDKDNERERTRLIKKYWEIKLDLAVEAFDHFKEKHMQQARHMLQEKVPSELLKANLILLLLKIRLAMNKRKKNSKTSKPKKPS